MKVKGPRYWQLTISAGPGDKGALAAPVKQWSAAVARAADGPVSGCRSSANLPLFQVAEVKVKGPKYWQQTVSARPGGKCAGALAALYSSGSAPCQAAAHDP